MTTDKQNKEVCWVCEGECGVKLSQEEWEKHETKVCGAEKCSHQGKPFVREEYKEENKSCSCCG